MNKYHYIGLFILIFILCSCHNSNDKDTKDTQPIEIDVALPQIDSIMVEKKYPAYLTAKVTVELVARVNGFLQASSFKAGDYVRKGQVLFVIEPKIYKEALAQAQAELQSAISQKEYALTNFNSISEAAKTNAVSKIDVVQAENSLNQAIASIANSKAAVATAKQNLSYCYVKSPINGQITKSNIDVGNYVNGSVSPVLLATVYDDSYMYVQFSIEDKMYLKLLASQNSKTRNVDYNIVPLKFGERLSKDYTGKLDYLSPNIDLSTGTMNVRAIVNNHNKELKSGMYTVVNLPIKDISQAILVKDSSIGTDQLGKYLYVVNDSNKIVYTPIVVGDLFNDSLRIVMSGLKAKDKYVTKALLKVRDGMIIKPIITK